MGRRTQCGLLKPRLGSLKFFGIEGKKRCGAGRPQPRGENPCRRPVKVKYSAPSLKNSRPEFSLEIAKPWHLISYREMPISTLQGFHF